MQFCDVHWGQLCLGSSACRLKVSIFMVPWLCRVQVHIRSGMQLLQALECTDPFRDAVAMSNWSAQTRSGMQLL